jgi:phosphoglycerate dehydrogenase-like enzyme
MSKKIEVLVTLPLPEELVEEISQTSEDISVTVLPAREGQEIPQEHWQKAEVVYTMHALPMPEQAPKLRWIQSYLSGIDKIRDDPLFDNQDLVLTTMSGANASQVAEHVLTMMLALGHNLPQFFELQRKNTWMEEKGRNYVPAELRDSTVGIIGYGSIGRQVAYLASTFGATILGTKRDLMKPSDSGYLAEENGDSEGELFTRLYPPQALGSMMKECDFVVVCVPLTSSTHNLVGKNQLAAMKPTAFLIDVSRGGVVDHNALITALDEKQLAGAALDVFPDEPLSIENPLWQMPNVIITPHVAGFSSEYSQRANKMFIENLKRYLGGEELLNQVDFDREY